MKKLIIIMAGILTLSSCGTTGHGAFSGAMFGGMIGSAIGGILGGPRGSDVGTIVGAAGGAAVGAAVEKSATESAGVDDAPYQEPAVGAEAPQAEVYDVDATETATAVRIKNLMLRDAYDACHISRGDTVRLSFEIHNATDEMLMELVPVVKETTGNERLLVSPAILIETLGARKAVRYTAYIIAAENLKKGTANFNVSVQSSGAVVSNTMNIEVPLN